MIKSLRGRIENAGIFPYFRYDSPVCITGTLRAVDELDPLNNHDIITSEVISCHNRVVETRNSIYTIDIDFEYDKK